MIFFVDLDNTLTSPVEREWTPDKGPPNIDTYGQGGSGWIGPPDPDSLVVLRHLYDEGHEIVIWSCRNNPGVMGYGTVEGLTARIRDWLNEHAIPFHRIETTPKPFFTYLIDDRAINPTADMDGLLLRYSRLKRFASHDDECPSSVVREPWETDEACTCGLANLLNEDWSLGLKGGVRDGSQEP